MLALILKHSGTNHPATFRAFNVLGRMGALAVRTLVATLGHSDWSHRAAAAESLGKIGPPARRAAGALLKALADKHRDVRMGAARALALIGTRQPAVISGLRGRLRRSKGRERIVVAWALLELGQDGGALKTLARHLFSRKPVERLRAAEALSKLGKRAAGAKTQIRRASFDEDGWVRLSAAQALAVLGDTARAMAVFRGLLGHHNEVLRFNSIRAMGKLPALRAQTIPLLRSVVADPNPIVRQEANEALMRLGR